MLNTGASESFFVELPAHLRTSEIRVVDDARQLIPSTVPPRQHLVEGVGVLDGIASHRNVGKLRHLGADNFLPLILGELVAPLHRVLNQPQDFGFAGQPSPSGLLVVRVQHPGQKAPEHMQGHHLGWDLTLTGKLVNGLQRIEATDSRLDQLRVASHPLVDKSLEGVVVLHPLSQAQWSRRYCGTRTIQCPAVGLNPSIGIKSQGWAVFDQIQRSVHRIEHRFELLRRSRVQNDLWRFRISRFSGELGDRKLPFDLRLRD